VSKISPKIRKILSSQIFQPKNAIVTDMVSALFFSPLFEEFSGFLKNGHFKNVQKWKTKNTF